MRNLRPPIQDNTSNNTQTRQTSQFQNNPATQTQSSNNQQNKNFQDMPKDGELKQVFTEEYHKTSQSHKTKPSDYKINPKQIPRPNNNDEIYLNLEKNIIYETSIGSVPPYSASYYSVKETQNSSPRFIRSTLNYFPSNQTILTSSSLILGLVCQPFCEIPEHEDQIPSVNAIDGIFRCQKCSAYINSKFQMTYSDSRKQVAVCNLCLNENEFDLAKSGMKAEYFSADTSTIPELAYPTIDFIAPTKFDSGKQFTPHYLFMIDISSTSNDMGLPSYILNSILSNLDYFHNVEQTHIAIALYDYKTVFFFHCTNEVINLSIMSDLNDPFCPVSISKLYLNVITQRESIEKLIEKLSVFIYERVESNKVNYKAASMPSGAAIKAGISSLIDNGGRVMLFTCSPCTHGYGACQPRDTLNKAKDEKINDFVPQHELFAKVAESAVEARVVVDQFVFFNNQYDLATLSSISNLTGGHVEFYQHSKEKTILNSSFEKMHYDITRIISRPNYYDVKTMIRFSQGLDCYEILGPFTKKLGEAFQLSSCDPDYTFSYNLRLNDSFKQQQKLHIQIACLYTDNFNQKYLRLFNMTYEATDEVAKLFNSSDVNTTAKMIIMKEISLLWRTDVDKVRKNLEDRIINSFKYYRIKEKSSTNPGQLILPVGIRYLPLLLNGFIKKGILKKGSVVNQMVYLMHRYMRDPLPNTMKMLYPKFYRIDDILKDQLSKFQSDKASFIDNIGLVNERFNMIQKPILLSLSKDNLDFDCAYILDDSLYISLFIFNQIEETFYEDLFDYPTWGENKDSGVSSLNEEKKTELNMRILNIINQLRKENGGHYQPVRLFFLSENSYKQPELINYLVEDKINEEMNYSDFLCMIHNEIHNRINN